MRSFKATFAVLLMATLVACGGSESSPVAQNPTPETPTPVTPPSRPESNNPWGLLPKETAPSVDSLQNSRLGSLDYLLSDGWFRLAGEDGIPTFTRDRVDNASSLFFNDRSFLVSAARAYTITGDTIHLDRAISIANNMLNLRDDIYQLNGGQAFKDNQTGYRAAVQPLLGSREPAAVWSHDFTDRAANGNPEAQGRRVQVLQNGRALSALAEVVMAYHTHLPEGNYSAPTGSQAGILEGSYENIANTLLTEINRSVRIFDPQWQQDIEELDLSGDPNNGLWDVKGSYFYDKRQNLSSEGVDIDGILPFNHTSGMLQARLVLAKFSDYDPTAVDHFNRWAEHHKSVYASDEPSFANPGLSSSDLFGFNTTWQAYKWPYTTHEALGEDIDHVIITLEVYMTAYRLSLIDRETIQHLYRSVETNYDRSGSFIYDRMFEFDASYVGSQLLSGTVNWLSNGTNLQNQFALLANTQALTRNINIREYEAVLAYYGAEQLSRFTAP